ncbi:MAG: matrixin family metalloprotease [Candidatus Levyibacteriota bacterium]
MQKVSPCDTPVAYKIGSVDPQFNLSSSQVLEDAQAAADILSKAEGKQLFVYSEKADLTINFSYDQRAELDTQINQLQTQLDQKGSNLNQQIKQYESDVEAFNQKLASFNATVDSYNKQGGAPEEVYKNLIDQQKQLQSEADALNARARQLKLSTREYNVGVSTLNQDTTQFNNAIAQRPEEGLYNGKEDTITLYFASNHNELIHTMAHEFGHALGMDHVPDKKAIMYAYTTENIAPTVEDMNELAKACVYEPMPLSWAKAFDRWLIISVFPIIQNYLK